jgi:hypothetical protein
MLWTVFFTDEAELGGAILGIGHHLDTRTKKGANPYWVSPFDFSGGRKRIRTSDFHRVRMALSPLSYPPIVFRIYRMTTGMAIENSRWPHRPPR